MNRCLMLAGAAWLAAVGCGGAASLPPSIVPGSPPGFNYPLSFDSITSAPSNHHLVYEDAHVRLLEVTLWPYVKEIMHGHAYSSVFAVYQTQPTLDNEHRDPWVHTVFGKAWRKAVTTALPRCMTMGPQSPHAATVTQDFPQHFFRLEFKHEEAASFARDWRTLYPEMTRPAVMPPPPPEHAMPAGWPYPASLESVRAAPGNYRTLFDDGLVRLVEVTIRPGETEHENASPYYAVNAYPAPAPGTPGGPSLRDHERDPSSPLLKRGLLGGSDKPAGLDGPTCSTVGPLPPHQVTNTSDVPIHYYRVEFRRVDGDDFPSKWREWYPQMARGPR